MAEPRKLDPSNPSAWQDYQAQVQSDVASGRLPNLSTVLDDSAVVDAITAAQEEQDDRTAFQIISDTLEQYGLSSLGPKAWQMMLDGTPPDSVLFDLRQTGEYKERFKGLEMRRLNGYSPMNEAQYINYEKNTRQLMLEAGIPRAFMEDDDIAEFIANDVSPNELGNRVAMAAAAVSNVNPELKNQLRELYGIGAAGEGELIGYFLDPERGVNAIEQRLQLESAGLSAASVQATGQGIKANVAKQLAGQNVQQREITARLAPQAGLTQATFSDQGVASSELAAAEFGLDPESAAQIRRLRQRRQVGAMQKVGGLMTNVGASGLGSAQNQ